MRIRSLVMLFLLALVVGIVVKVPVALFIKDGRLGNAMVYGAQGTLWSGSATLVRLGAHEIATPRWSVKPAYLLLGRLKAAVEFVYLDGRGGGDVSLSLGKAVNLSDFDYTLQADQITQTFASGFVGLEGDINLQIDNIDHQLGERFVSEAAAYIGWQKSGVAYPISAALGNISINLSQDDDSGLLQAELSNQGGELSLSGEASLGGKLDYQVDVKLTPTASMGDTLRATLEAAMPRKPDGSYQFIRSGNLGKLRLGR